MTCNASDVGLSLYVGKQLIFAAPFSGNQCCNNAVGAIGPMLMKLVYGMTRKYLVSQWQG